METLKAKIKGDPLLPGFLKGCLLIGINNNLRVSEMLRIGNQQVTSNGMFSLKRSKGKGYISISIYTAEEYAAYIESANESLEMYTDRHFIYRLFKKWGISYQSSLSSKRSVTHAIRHITASELRRQNDSESKVQSALHHTSSKSQKYYGK